MSDINLQSVHHPETSYTEDTLAEANRLLGIYCERRPAPGMHIGYLTKAAELADIYGEILDLMEEEKNSENEQRVAELVEEIKIIVD